MTAVAVRDLVVVRGSTTAVAGVSFEVAEGEVVGLLGPSGSGKTSLMRALVGVQVVRSGSVTVFGERAGSASLRRRIGYVTQAPSVYGDLTVRENLRFFGRVLGVGEGRIEATLRHVDLVAHAGRMVGGLSGGERSRVSLAAALLGEPRLLVLDEPTVELDPVLRRDLWQLFRDTAAQGATLLVSSHVMDEAARCDRLLLMRGGELVADETPAALLAQTGAATYDEAFLSLVEHA